MDFTQSELAKADFDAKMAVLKQRDTELAAATMAREAAFSELQAKEQAVTDAEAALVAADKEADIALKIYEDALAVINVVPVDQLPATAIGFNFGAPVPKV